MLIKLYNEEYLIYVEQTYFPQWHDRKYLYYKFMVGFKVN